MRMHSKYTSTALRHGARKQLRFSSLSSTRPEQEHTIPWHCLRTFKPPASPPCTPPSPCHDVRLCHNPHHMPKSISGVSALVHVQRLARWTHHQEKRADPFSLAKRRTCNAGRMGYDQRKKWPGSVAGLSEFVGAGNACICLMVSRGTRISSGESNSRTGNNKTFKYCDRQRVNLSPEPDVLHTNSERASVCAVTIQRHSSLNMP